jgi:antitoxin Phd
MTQVSLSEARTQLSELVHQAEAGGPVYITRRGKPVAILLSAEEYRRLSGGQQRNFWDEIQEWRAGASFDWPDLTPEEVNSWRDKSPGREFSWGE